MAYPSAAFWSMAVAVCAVAAVADGRTNRIPNLLTLPTIAAGLALNGLTVAPVRAAGFYEPIGLRLSVAGAGLGFGVMLCVAIASQGGGGDVKLAAALGALLGPYAVFAVLGLTCLSALVGTIAFLILRHGAAGAARRLIGRPTAVHNPDAPDAVSGRPADPLRVPLGPYFLIGTVATALFPVVQR